MTEDIRQFFETYRAAFNQLDEVAIARLYAEPSGIASQAGYTHWATREQVADNMHKLCALYRDGGFRRADFAPSSYLPQGEDFAVVDVAWRIERTGGQAPWEFHTTYNLMRQPEGWRVLLCTAYEEARRC